ncbi:conjugal transfer protein TraF [Elizabethkingia anophelis]|nr:conjugal transfer protein TraF [Elizabethkingia anophelis]
MSEYNINKGIGRNAEFKGLESQYLFLLGAGMLGILVLVMVFYMAGMNTYVCLILGFSGGSLVSWLTFSLNKKYGRHGLMKLRSRRKYPEYILSRKALSVYLKPNSKEISHEK